jgi:N-acetyl-anhydromuramyl-L-alanine amidase AmpD
MIDPTKLPFIQANRFRVANRTTIDWIVIHTMEIAQTSTTALQCARDFATTSDNRSAHYCVDNATIIHCVQEKDIAFAAPPNTPGMELEHAGFASMTAAEWGSVYSTAMLQLSAQLSASIVLRYDVPIVWLSSQDLIDGKRGFTSHANISNAFHQTDHQDPGPNFPHQAYLQMVDLAVQPFIPAPPAVADAHGGLLALTQPHTQGSDVRAVQQALVDAGFTIPVDGDFGLLTQGAVKAFQEAQGLTVDGIVGPETRAELGIA